jgi:hypothetical protein
MITLTPRKSTNIAAAGYDPVSQVLAIRFHGSGGKVHHYMQVEPAVAAAFDKAPSPGRYFIQQIRDCYGFEVILDEPEDGAEDDLGDFSANDTSKVPA